MFVEGDLMQQQTIIIYISFNMLLDGSGHNELPSAHYMTNSVYTVWSVLMP